MKQSAVEWLVNEIPSIDQENSYWKNKIKQAKRIDKVKEAKRLLFIGKVSQVIGFDKTSELLKEVEQEIKYGI